MLGKRLTYDSGAAVNQKLGVIVPIGAIVSSKVAHIVD